jgi:hypothetical protein
VTKEERAKLIRARFALKWPDRAWVSQGKKRKPQAPVHYNAIRLTPYNDSICFGGGFGGNREGKITDWTLQQDTKQRMAIIATDHYADRVSIVTKIAEEMYRYNRMGWEQAVRKGSAS